MPNWVPAGRNEMSRWLSLLAAVLLVASLAPSVPAAPERGHRAQPEEDEDEPALPDGAGSDDEGDSEGDGENDEPPVDPDAHLPRDADGVPVGYRRVEKLDLTIGMRDDSFLSIELDENGRVYVGTFEGRAYTSTDNGTTWAESWVIPETKSFYGFPGQRMFLGSLRSDDTVRAQTINTAPAIGSPAHNWGLSSLGDGIQQFAGDNGRVLSDGPATERAGITNPYGVGRLTSAPASSIVTDAYPGAISPYAEGARMATEAPGAVLGAALSARAPRLSLLLTIKRRPIANISLQRLLLSVALRLNEVRRIIPDPSNPQHLLAATWYGQYTSYDGGVSWVRAFPGLTAAERGIYDIVFDPSDPNRVYMGTGRGLFISDDAGESWTKSTSVPEIMVKKVAVDPKNRNNVYVAGLGGVFRSNDRLQTVSLSYYSSLFRWNDVFWIAIDPNDSDTAYLGTGAGLVRTTNLRDSSPDDWQFLKPMRLENLVTPVVRACSRHPGHIYAMTRADLPTINYGANGPESMVIESWNAGEDWRVLSSLRTAGDVQYFTLDPRDPDQVWIAFSRSIVRVKRLPEDAELIPVAETGQVLADWPTVGQVLEAALKYHQVDVGSYQRNLDRLRKANWAPNRLNVSFFAANSNAGATHDDLQFAFERYLAAVARNEWRIMAFATWRLPDLVYQHNTVAMQRVRVLMMNDEVRNRIYTVVQRNYGELQRLIARQRAGVERDLYTRAVEQSRREMLEAMIDLVSGGYLTKWKQDRGTR